MNDQLLGIVKWFNTKKGFGFIICEGLEYFVHFKSINQPGFKNLNEGDKVKFSKTKTAKGYQAENVCIVKAKSGNC